jgi:hypothetical protein
LAWAIWFEDEDVVPAGRCREDHDQQPKPDDEEEELQHPQEDVAAAEETFSVPIRCDPFPRRLNSKGVSRAASSRSLLGSGSVSLSSIPSNARAAVSATPAVLVKP